MGTSIFTYIMFSLSFHYLTNPQVEEEFSILHPESQFSNYVMWHSWYIHIHTSPPSLSHTVTSTEVSSYLHMHLHIIWQYLLAYSLGTVNIPQSYCHIDWVYSLDSKSKEVVVFSRQPQQKDSHSSWIAGTGWLWAWSLASAFYLFIASAWDPLVSADILRDD